MTLGKKKVTNKQAQKRRWRRRLPKLISHPLRGSVSLVEKNKRTNKNRRFQKHFWQITKENVATLRIQHLDSGTSPGLVEAFVFCVEFLAQGGGGWRRTRSDVSADEVIMSNMEDSPSPPTQMWGCFFSYLFIFLNVLKLVRLVCFRL